MTTICEKSILVVDDDPQIRKLIGTILKRAGYGVITAADGRQALREIESRSVDLVVCDLIMPEKEGIETITEIRQKQPGLSIIAISGGGKINPKTYLDITLKIGAVATMTKPIDADQLKTMVRDLLAAPPAV